jgi:photosystem II stability/assembly factor-like uncharacterized protein
MLLAAQPGWTAPSVAAASPTDQPIWRATHGVLLSVTRAGKRLVATGDRGIVLLSDDDGASWAISPTGSDELLTAAVFTDARQGWVVGQDSTILHTTDGGAHWVTQTTAAGNDQALFSIASLAPGHLIATGAYALVLETQNGGAAWTPVKLPNLDEDYHLNCVQARGADVVVTGEAGHAFVRHDTTWTPMPVPYDGSQFGCLTARDGDIYSFGLRGSLFVSTAAAPPWRRIDTGEQRAIFGGTLLSNGFMALVGGNGLVMLFDPQTGKQRTLPPPTGATLSGVAEAANGKWVVVGNDGVHVVDPTAAGEVTQ